MSIEQRNRRKWGTQHLRRWNASAVGFRLRESTASPFGSGRRANTQFASQNSGAGHIRRFVEKTSGSNDFLSLSGSRTNRKIKND
jgi:hypothetical protein